MPGNCPACGQRCEQTYCSQGCAEAFGEHFVPRDYCKVPAEIMATLQAQAEIRRAIRKGVLPAGTTLESPVGKRFLAERQRWKEDRRGILRAIRWPAEITPVYAGILLVFAQEEIPLLEDVLTGEIARRMGMSAAQMRARLGQLVRRNYLERVEIPETPRIYLLSDFAFRIVEKEKLNG